MSTIIKEEALVSLLQQKLNTDMLRAVEPVIQKALFECERKMRKELGAFIISHIEKSMSVDTYGENIRILIKQGNIKNDRD